MAMLANQKNNPDPMAMTAMMNGGMGANNWMNNPFAYIMFLALFRNGFGGWGNGDGAGAATQGIETQAQLNAIRTQLQDTSNADCIKSAIQGNGFAISQLAQTLTSTRCRSVVAMFRLLSSKLQARLVSPLSVLSTLSIWATAMSFRLSKTAAARLSNSYSVWASRISLHRKTQSMRFKRAYVIWALVCRQVSTVPIRVLKEALHRLVTTLRSKLATSLLPATPILSVSLIL